MDRIEFVRSRAKNAGGLFIGIALVAGSVFVAMTDDLFSRVLGWSGAAFFGLAILVAVRDLLRGGTAYTFDRGGITDHGHGVVIPWSEIEECAVITIHGNRFLGILFRHPEQFLARESAAGRKLARFNAQMGWGHWALTFAGVSPGIDEALRFIETCRLPGAPGRAPGMPSTRTT